jgi:methionyl-tRNA synthetase
MPRSSQNLLGLLNLPVDLEWSDADNYEILLSPGHRCQPPSALFPRIRNLEEATQRINQEMTMLTNLEINPQDQETTGLSQPKTHSGSTPAASEAAEEASAAPTIEYDDFAKVELRVAKVLEAERIPKADKLLRLQVDLGSEQRQILAGIAQQFEPDDLVGKTVVVVANLAPRKMRGLESQGMILAASTPDGPPLGLVTVDANVAPGSVVK